MTAGDRRGRSGGQRGFTLIELMVALLVSSLLVGMILAIFSRMSMAYRGQQQIAGVQQVLAAARATIERDAKQAGLGVTQGFTTSFSAAPLPPVTITDGGAGPDQIALFYADTSVQARITTASLPTSLDIDDGTGFTPGDLIVLTKPDTTTPSPFGEANITTHTACVLQIAPPPTTVTVGPPGRLTLATTGPWAGTGNCPAALQAAGVMVYRFVARAYQIDISAGRIGLGALQQSATGNLLGGAEVWSDLAYGFSDLQIAVRAYHDADVADPDGDTDLQRDWYSGANQSGVAASAIVLAAPNVALLQMSISLVARTDRPVEGIATSQVPALTAAPTDNNWLGNHASVTMPSANLLYPSSRIYRYTTFQVDFRNLGVGR